MKPFQKLTKVFILIFIISICFTSCNKDDGSSMQQDPQNQDHDAAAFAQNFGTEITRSFLGTVVDSNNNPIENVSITIGSSMAMTDANGIFIINDATINERFGYIKAQKAGFIHASRAVVPSSGTNKVRIMMLPETFAGSTSSGTQETIALPNGASVALEGEYVNEDGSAYSGTVDVILHHLDPAEETMRDQMPGMLYAANSQNEERMLQTFGMLAVELRGSTGEDLNLAEGSTAEITVPLDPSLLADAPATIPLWYFDEANGYWIEDGQATLVGDAYVGTVSHFSFWNCDIPAEYVDFCVTVTNSDGDLISNVIVTLTSANYGTGYGYTNENGETCGLIPSNEILEINVYNYDLCETGPIYSGTVGPFTEDSSAMVTINDNTDIISESVIGVFNDCNNDPVTDGYVQLRYGNQYFSDVVNDGNFEINLLRCPADNTFTIKASDFANLQVTDSISYTFTTPITTMGTINACNSVTEFLYYSIDNDEEVFQIIDGSAILVYVFEDDLDNVNICFEGCGTNSSCLYMCGRLFPSSPIGTYDYLELNDPADYGFFFNQTIDMTNINNTVTYNMTSFGNVGDYIDMNFSGSYEDSNGIPHTIDGIIHLLRDE